MTGLGALIRRNVKLYFKDKGMFLTSLITPVILLVLYVTFLRSVYEDSFRAPFEQMGMMLSDEIVNGFVGGQLISSILAVSCVTVAFCSNLLSVQDKLSGARRDLNVSPVKPSTIAVGYFMSTFISSALISVVAAAVCFIWLGATGCGLSVGDTVLTLLDTLLLVLFGTSLSSCIIYPLTTQGQASAVGTIVSAGYGFVCGAYMPISSFSPWLQRILSFFPGTYGTSLIRNHALRGVLADMESLGIPEEALGKIRESFDCKLFFFGHEVGIGEMYAVLGGVTAVLVAVYILINALSARHVIKRK